MTFTTSKLRTQNTSNMGSRLIKKSGVKPKRAVPAANRAGAKKPAKKVEEKVQEEELQLPSESDSEDDSDFEQPVKGDSDSDSDDEEEEEKLGGFESTDDEEEEDNEIDGEDSSDDEEVAEEQTQKKAKKPETHEVKKLPKKTTDKASNKKKKVEKGVIYIGRLPEGFEEKELQKYFNQFGDITNVKLPRNQKTGRSKHYAFVEFSNSEDAKVAQETMNNYLLLNHQLKVNVVDEEFRSSKKFKKAFFKVSKPKKDVKTLNENSKKKCESRMKALQAAGIDF